MLAGLLELVERDAVMLTWANRLSLPLLTWDEHADSGGGRPYFGSSRLRYSVLDGSASSTSRSRSRCSAALQASGSARARRRSGAP